MSEKLSEYQAAQQFKMSPTLLRWMTANDPKGDGRKLPHTDKAGIFYFDRKDLIDFDAYLRLPWPKPQNGQRPYIPAGIQNEIKVEAHFRCPACNTNMGELAHIEAVSKTFNNHPHNLIYLCPNHHTAYDFGHKYRNLRREDVDRFKDGLQLFQSIRWGLESDIIESYLSLVFKLGVVLNLEENDLKGLQSESFEQLFKLGVKKLRKIKDAENLKKEVKEVIRTVKIPSGTKPRDEVTAYFSIKPQMTAILRKDPDLCECPLCETKGYTSVFDICPVCDGEGFVDANRNIDLEKYELDDCPLCDGKGHTDYFESCPPCNGEGKLTREQIGMIDFDQFEIVDCPLCKGYGHTSDFEECPACGGEGKLTAALIDQIDFDQYEIKDCPLCDGHGSNSDFDVCPACAGEGKLTAAQIDKIDFSRFDLDDCPVCEGNGSTSYYDTCPACGGEGKVTRDYLRKIDVSDYELEECLLCKGKGWTNKYETCPPCGGEGEIPRKQIDSIDWDKF